MATDPWAAFEEVGAPAAPGVIHGRPKSVDPLEERRLDITETTAGLQQQLTQLQIEEKQRAAAQSAEKKAVAGKADNVARNKLLRVIAKMTSIDADADDNGGWFETGATGAFSRKVLPDGTAGYDLAADLKTLEANFAFDALQAIRDASKTGGALGAITEKELELLQAATANINPNQGHDSFRNNLEEARQVYLAKLAMIDPQSAARLGYDGAAAEKAIMSLAGGDVAIDRRAGTQTTEPVPADIEAIMAKYGAR